MRDSHLSLGPLGPPGADRPLPASSRNNPFDSGLLALSNDPEHVEGSEAEGRIVDCGMEKVKASAWSRIQPDSASIAEIAYYFLGFGFIGRTLQRFAHWYHVFSIFVAKSFFSSTRLFSSVRSFSIS